MKQNKIDLYVYSFYRFIDLKNIKLVKSKLEKFFFNKKLKGTILLSLEGINASIDGSAYDI